MNSVQESKNELEAAIRYAENAISSAKQTIESMEFRQEMAQKNYQEQTGREQALEAKVEQLKSDRSGMQDCIKLRENQLDDMRASAFADAKTIEHLKNVKQELENKLQGQYDDIVQLERDLTVKTSQAEAWKKEAREAKEGAPTMPVIPKDVAVAIFREGVQSGINDAVAELEGQSINISENDYVGDFSISFERDIDLDDHLDLDWMRDKVGQYEESFVVGALKNLCADKEFECRIHGVDDNTIDLTKKND